MMMMNECMNKKTMPNFLKLSSVETPCLQITNLKLKIHNELGLYKILESYYKYPKVT